MKNKIYLDKFILSSNNVNNLMYTILENDIYKKKIKKEKNIGYTSFGFPIECYKIGTGPRHVIIFGATHGCEIITTYFTLEFILTLLNDNELYDKYNKIYTFHIIPILNKEGYMISTSNILETTNTLSNSKLEKLASKYLELYNLDDDMASKCIISDKKYRNIFKTSTEYIPDIRLRKNVEKILNCCRLNSNVLPTWSSNGMGIDLNRNSIHKFKLAKKTSCKKKCGPLRYNDIPITKKSPIGYPGKIPFDPECPENLLLHKYINTIYNYNYNKNVKDKLIAIFSFHSTAGEIYGVPDCTYVHNHVISSYMDVMQKYSSYTGYKIIDENLKYGIMDYYRVILKNVYALTIELSKLNGNPIGPLANLDEFKNEIQLNKIAIFNTLNYISKYKL